MQIKTVPWHWLYRRSLYDNSVKVDYGTDNSLKRNRSSSGFNRDTQNIAQLVTAPLAQSVERTSHTQIIPKLA